MQKTKTIKMVNQSPIAKIPVSAPEKAPAIKRETVSIVESAVRSASMPGEDEEEKKNKWIKKSLGLMN